MFVIIKAVVESDAVLPVIWVCLVQLLDNVSFFEPGDSHDVELRSHDLDGDLCVIVVELLSSHYTGEDSFASD